MLPYRQTISPWGSPTTLAQPSCGAWDTWVTLLRIKLSRNIWWKGTYYFFVEPLLSEQMKRRRRCHLLIELSQVHCQVDVTHCSIDEKLIKYCASMRAPLDNKRKSSFRFSTAVIIYWNPRRSNEFAYNRFCCKRVRIGGARDYYLQKKNIINWFYQFITLTTWNHIMHL